MELLTEKLEKQLCVAWSGERRIKTCDSDFMTRSPISAIHCVLR